MYVCMRRKHTAAFCVNISITIKTYILYKGRPFTIYIRIYEYEEDMAGRPEKRVQQIQRGGIKFKNTEVALFMQGEGRLLEFKDGPRAIYIARNHSGKVDSRDSSG